MKDVKYKGLCAKLILELKSKGISDNKVLDAISKIPRHLLFEPILEMFAYQDMAFPIELIKQ